MNLSISPTFISSLNYLLIYFWLHWVFTAAHGLSLAAASGGCSLVGVHRLLIVLASLVIEHSVQRARASAVAVRRLSCPSMWNLPRPGVKPVAPELAGRLPTTGPLGKSEFVYFKFHI